MIHVVLTFSLQQPKFDVLICSFRMEQHKSGFTQVREKSGKITFPQGQGKVREFKNWSGNFEFDIKSGNCD